MFIHRIKVQFYETDLMGIVHHSNYLRFYEEARVGWAHVRGLIDYQKPESASHFAVYETQVKHIKPTFFGDELAIEVQGKVEGNRLIFQYRLTGRNGEVCSLGKTVHVSLTKDLKLMRMPATVKAVTEKEQWTEIWL
jgi:acyl-CoA thioester hydrolase